MVNSTNSSVIQWLDTVRVPSSTSPFSPSFGKWTGFQSSILQTHWSFDELTLLELHPQLCQLSVIRWAEDARFWSQLLQLLGGKMSGHCDSLILNFANYQSFDKRRMRDFNLIFSNFLRRVHDWKLLSFEVIWSHYEIPGSLGISSSKFSDFNSQ